MEGLEAAVWLSSPAPGGGSAASHFEVAMSVASRSGRRGPGVHAAGTALDLGFVPVTLEDFDIVLGGDALPAADDSPMRRTSSWVSMALIGKRRRAASAPLD